MTTMWVSLIAVAACAIGTFQQPGRRLNSAEIEAVKLAIIDEIYDYNRQEASAYVGPFVNSGAGVQLTVFVEPAATNGAGRVLYKYMPFGEVLRSFLLMPNGSVRLSGETNGAFPFHATFTDVRTVYLDDKVVCDMKARWVKSKLVVLFKPDATALIAASERQILRVGWSERLGIRKQ